MGKSGLIIKMWRYGLPSVTFSWFYGHVWDFGIPLTNIYYGFSSDILCCIRDFLDYELVVSYVPDVFFVASGLYIIGVDLGAVFVSAGFV